MDVGVDGGDALSDISSLVANGATSITVQYNHCFTAQIASQQDNHVWLMVLAYTAEPCSQVLSLGPDTAFCEGTSYILDASGIQGDHVWQDGSAGNTFTTTTSGSYYVTITNGACQWTDSVNVSVQPYPSFDLGTSITLCLGKEAQLDAYAGPQAAYVWQDGSTGPTLTVSTSGTYWATATIAGCSFTDSVAVGLDSCLILVSVPNIFTPNGDASNNTFQPALRGVFDVSLNVYNRWGQRIQTSTARQPIWDGRTESGMPVPDGTYYWILGYTRSSDQVYEELHGTVTLLR